ncbi:Protein-hormone receptor [Blomia tropicalis]|nr:Protein-hormone receptor [Blomia tropicalis]
MFRLLTSNEINDFESHQIGQLDRLSQLRKLYLNQNRLTRLNNFTFISFSILEYLNLASNQIDTLEQYCFIGLSRLRILDLSFNRIKAFPSDQLQLNILSQLAEINLRNNLIHWIPEQAFTRRLPLPPLPFSANQSTSTLASAASAETNSTLTKLDLGSNPLVQVHRYAFVNLPQLRKLYLSEVEHQDQFPSLLHLDSLEHFKWDRSRLSHIDDNLCHHVGGTIKSLVLILNQIRHLPTSLPLCTELRVLDLSNNQLHTIPERAFIGQGKLIDLGLGHNQIETIENEAFIGLVSLKVLNLENNQIVHIDSHAFVPLESLRDINLGYNHFASLPTDGLTKLIELKVHGNRNLREFPPIESFPYVHNLALSYAYHCCAFLGRVQAPSPDSDSNTWQQLHDAILWLGDSDPSNVNMTINELEQQLIKHYTRQPADYMEYDPEQRLNGIYDGDLLASIESPSTFPWDSLIENQLDTNQKRQEIFLQAGHSPKSSKFIRCLPQPGPFMPCKDLFDWWTLRFGVWLVFPLALIGNGTVLVVLVFGRRRRRRRKLDVPRFLVCNLAAADFFMGIYLGMLALVDASTLGYFRSYAVRWQNSWACQLTGFTGVLSSELSVYTLAVITLERNYAITHAMHLNKRLSLRAATTIMSIGWIFALCMAILPLVGVSDYRKFAICLPFEIEGIWSLLYVISLIVINGFAFLLLMGCYLRMYCAIRGSQAWNSNDTRIAMRMGLLVFTDFLCWAPIAFFTITAVAGWHLISLEEAKIFTVFVLPLNACANPFLYAFFTKQFKKECATLYKRIDAVTSPLTQYCTRKDDSTEDDFLPEPCVECPVCGHRSRNQSKVLNVTVSRGQSPICPQSDNSIERNIEPVKALMVTNHRSDDGIANQCHIVDEPNLNVENAPIKEEEEDDGKPENNVPTDGDDECKCRCHCHCESSTNKESSAGDKSWSATRMVRNLLAINLERANTTNSLNSSSSTLFNKRTKQFKSNSIIYQSNYRKNHVHMTLENEMIRTPSPNLPNNKSSKSHPKLTRYSSDNLETRKQQRHHQQSCSSRQHWIGSSHASKLERNVETCKNISCDSQYEFSYYGRKDSTSTMRRLSSSSDAATKSTSSSFVSSGIWNSSKSGTSSNSAADEKELILNQFHMRQLFELSRPMKSNDIESFDNELINNGRSHRYLVLSFCVEQFKQFFIDRHTTHNGDKFLDLPERIEENVEWSMENVDVECKDHKEDHIGGDPLDKIDSEQLSILYLLSKSAHQQCSSSSSSSYMETKFESFQEETVSSEGEYYDQLEVFFLINRNIDNHEQLKHMLNNELNHCNDCIEHYLINGLMEQITSNKNDPESIGSQCLESYSPHTLLFRCSVRQLRITDRFVADENANKPITSSRSKSPLEEKKSSNNGATTTLSTSNTNSKRLSTSHEKIMNFLQILLPRSAKLGGSGTGSADSGRKVTPTISKHHHQTPSPNCKGLSTAGFVSGTRRSSSAFVLGEEIKSSHLHGIDANQREINGIVIVPFLSTLDLMHIQRDLIV